MPTLFQKSSSLPSTTRRPGPRVIGLLADSSSRDSGDSGFQDSAASSASVSRCRKRCFLGGLFFLGLGRVREFGGAFSEAVSSTSGVVTISSMASTTLSQLRPITARSCPTLAAAAAAECPDAAAQRGQHGVAVEELGDGRQFAHRADRRHDGQRAAASYRLVGGLLGDQLLARRPGRVGGSRPGRAGAPTLR